MAKVERAAQGSEGDEDIRPLAPTKEVRRHLVRVRVRARARVGVTVRVRVRVRVIVRVRLRVRVRVRAVADVPALARRELARLRQLRRVRLREPRRALRLREIDTELSACGRTIQVDNASVSLGQSRKVSRRRLFWPSLALAGLG